MNVEYITLILRLIDDISDCLCCKSNQSIRRVTAKKRLHDCHLHRIPTAHLLPHYVAHVEDFDNNGFFINFDILEDLHH